MLEIRRPVIYVRAWTAALSVLGLPPSEWAMTACSGDPADSASWRREILPLCARCDALISRLAPRGGC